MPLNERQVVTLTEAARGCGFVKPYAVDCHNGQQSEILFIYSGGN